MFAKIVVGCFSALIMFGAILFGIRFFGPPIWNHIIDGETALRQQSVLVAQIQADKVAYAALVKQNALDAQAAEARCDARVRSAQSFASTLAKYGAPAKLVDGKRPYLGPDALDAM